MFEQIKAKLDEIEKVENVHIIYAVESGSRAWGFASSDSDYDVRFIYVRDTKDYLRLDEKRDVIEWQLDDVFDINGWDVQKALRLMNASNPTLFEWNNSEIIYKTTLAYDEIKNEINKYFKMKKMIYHYLNTANSQYNRYLTNDQVIIKKYFYVLRCIFACNWILKNNEAPPILFTDLLESELDENINIIIEGLLNEKINSTSEKLERPRINELDDYIVTRLGELEEIVNNLPSDESNDWEGLNRLFLRILKYYKEI